MRIFTLPEYEDLIGRFEQAAADCPDPEVKAEIERATTELAGRVALLALAEPEGSA